MAAYDHIYETITRESVIVINLASTHNRRQLSSGRVHDREPLVHDRRHLLAGLSLP